MEYKQSIVDCNSDDIVNSNLFTGIHGNYLAPSIRKAGINVILFIIISILNVYKHPPHTHI